jgi:hypothetical protein
MARRLVLRLGLAVLFVSLAVHGARADEPDFARSGPYIGVGASRTANLVEAFLDGTPILEDIDVSNSWGVNTRLGYRLTSWFALEAEYEWLDRMNASLNGVNVGSLQMQSATANLLSPAEVKLNTGSVSVSENGIGTVTFQAGLGFRF